MVSDKLIYLTVIYGCPRREDTAILCCLKDITSCADEAVAIVPEPWSCLDGNHLSHLPYGPQRKPETRGGRLVHFWIPPGHINTCMLLRDHNECSLLPPLWTRTSPTQILYEQHPLTMLSPSKPSGVIMKTNRSAFSTRMSTDGPGARTGA